MIIIHTISEERFDALVRRHIAFFRKLALRILKNREDADDAVQNALLKGWRRRLFLRNQKSLLSWICQIVVNESYNILRTRQNEYDIAMQPPQDQTGQDDGQDAALLRLDAAIADLPVLYRDTVNVAILSGIGVEEAASLLGCSVNALYQRIHKAKQLLREALKDE